MVTTRTVHSVGPMNSAMDGCGRIRSSIRNGERLAPGAWVSSAAVLRAAASQRGSVVALPSEGEEGVRFVWGGAGQDQHQVPSHAFGRLEGKPLLSGSGG